MIKRIGFACKYMHPDQTQTKKVLEEIQRPLNTKSTTVQWLNRQTREVAEERLWDIMVHNVQSYMNLITYVGGLPNELRMVRLGSDVLPVYTQHEWSYFWRKPDVVAYCEKNFANVGKQARALDVRLSMHPSATSIYQAGKVQPVLNMQSTTDFLKRRETLLRSRTTKTNGESQTVLSLPIPAHSYSTYTITGQEKVNIFYPPMIDLNA